MRERLQQLIDTNEFEFLKTMSEEDIWKFAFAIFYVFSEREERTGHWIDYRDDGFVECPFCGHATNCEDDIDELHYCFYCGHRMVEPQESEDKGCTKKR